MAATTPDDPVLVLNVLLVLYVFYVFYVPYVLYVLYAPYVPCPISQYFRHGTWFYVRHASGFEGHVGRWGWRSEEAVGRFGGIVAGLL